MANLRSESPFNPKGRWGLPALLPLATFAACGFAPGARSSSPTGEGTCPSSHQCQPPNSHGLRPLSSVFRARTTAEHLHVSLSADRHSGFGRNLLYSPRGGSAVLPNGGSGEPRAAAVGSTPVPAQSSGHRNARGQRATEVISGCEEP